MTPSLQEILDGYKAGQFTAEQCRQWIEEKVKAAAGPVVIELRMPAVERIADLLEREARKG